MRAVDVAGAAWFDIDTVADLETAESQLTTSRRGARRALCARWSWAGGGGMSAEPAKRRIVRWGALGIGVILFFVTLYYINFRLAVGTIRQLGIALPLVLVVSGLWHLVRTWAWAWCFPRPLKVSFLRLARVRLAAEAFSYLTLRGIAGEPLKVVLLADSIDPREATAAVALERLAYLVGTTIIVGVGSVLALIGLPLTPVWFRVFRAFAIAGGLIALMTAIVVSGRGTYFQSWVRRFDEMMGTQWSSRRISRFVSAVERQTLELVRGNPKRLAILLVATVGAYVCMALECWVILRSTATPITLNGALAVETFSRVASFGSAFIPANLGALEASSLAAAAAVGAAGGGAALALARRLRGLFWAGLGLAIYPRARRTEITADARNGIDRSSNRHPTIFYFPQDDDVVVKPSARLAGLALAERVLRASLKAGYTRIVAWAPSSRECRSSETRRLRKIVRDLGGRVTVATNEDEWQAAVRALDASEPVSVVGPGTIVAYALLSAARTVPVQGGNDAVVDVPAGVEWPESGVLRVPAAVAIDRERILAELRERRTRALPLPSGLGRRGRSRPAGAAHHDGGRAPRRGTDDPARELQGHRRQGRTLQPPDLAANQHRADPDAAHGQPALRHPRRDRVVCGMALQHRALLDGRPGRVPVACRQRPRRLRWRDRPVEVSGVGAGMLDRDRRRLLLLPRDFRRAHDRRRSTDAVGDCSTGSAGQRWQVWSSRSGCSSTCAAA